MEFIYPERPIRWHDLIYRLQKVLADVPEVYLVGGVVRDVYRDRPMKDVDLACARDGQPVARKIANAFKGDYYPLDAERGVGRAIIEFQGERWILDVASFRGDSLLSDLQARDFTMNAMAVPLDSELEGIYDPLGGIRDIHAKILRRCSPTSIADDPIRALRAVRQSLQHSLMIEPATKEDIRREGQRLPASSIERVRDEFFAMLNSPKPQSNLMVMDTLGLLTLVIPEVELLKSNPQAWRLRLLLIDRLVMLLTVISPSRDDNLAANASYGTFVYLLDRFRGFLRQHIEQTWANERTHRMLLVFAMLLNDQPAQIVERALALRLSSPEVKRLQDITRIWQQPLELHATAPLQPRQVYRFWRMAGEAGIDACLLATARYLVLHDDNLDVPKWTAFLQTLGSLLEGYEQAMNVTPLVSGNDVMETFDLKPGPQIGALLEALREAQVLGEIETVAAALAYAKNWLAQQG